MIKDALFGLAVGDALGVPVEFMEREELRSDPVVDMLGYGTYDQPPATWSDDSSLTFCLAESLISGYNLASIAESFLRWYNEGHWTPYGEVFDIGIATRQALAKLAEGVSPELSGGDAEPDNGNGSLMRILPLVFVIHQLPIEERFRMVKEVSSITHRHIRSVLACFYYTEFARLLIMKRDLFAVYEELKTTIPSFLVDISVDPKEILLFSLLFNGNIASRDESEIQSSGYVIHTLEASIWCLLTTTSYRECVLKAVNLGSDTDTTAAVVGGLAGMHYGYDQIPTAWVDQLARKSDIEKLSGEFGTKLFAL